MSGRPWQRRRALRLLAAALFVVPPFLPWARFAAEGAAGVLDPAFGSGGIVTTDVGPFLRGSNPEVTSADDHDQATALDVLGDDRIVVAGFGTNGQPNGDEFVVARYGADGHLDPAFGTGGLAASDFVAEGLTGGDAQARALAVTSDGRVLAAGRAHGDWALARYRPDGSADTSFNDSGRVTTDLSQGGDDAIYGVGLQPDGRIVAGGYSSGTGGEHRFTLLRYLADGGRDFSPFGGSDTPTQEPVITSFGGVQEEARAVAVEPDGSVVAAGGSVAEGGATRFVAARFTPEGNPDTGFGDQGRVVVDLGSPSTGDAAGGARALALQADGAILLAGAAPAGPDDSRPGFAVIRLHPDGSRDTAFGDQGVARAAFGDQAGGRAVAVTPDGKIVAAGFTSAAPGQVAIVRFGPDGRLDASFGPAGGAVATAIGGGAAAANGLGLGPDGAAVVAGVAQAPSPAGSGSQAAPAGSDFALARYLADPRLSIGDLRIGEGDTGETEGRFAVSLSAPAGALGVSVDYATADGTAVAPGDYQPARGTLHIAPGEIETTVSVLVNGDRRDAANRLFFVDLANPGHATLGRARAMGTIVDDEPLVAETVAGGPGLVARLHVDAPESGAVLRQVCLDPRRAPCLDLATLPAGPGPNPRTVRGITFEVDDADGVPQPNTQIETSGDRPGLVVGASLGVWLPDGVGAAELTVTRSGPPVTVEAFAADGESVGAAVTTAAAGSPERLVAPATRAVDVAQQPFGVASAGGVVYVADPAGHRVRVVDPAPVAPGCPCETGFAGNGAEGDAVDGHDPFHVPLGGPYAVAPGEAGELYIADTFGHRILRVVTGPGADPPAAKVTTVAGTGVFGFSGDGSAARSARLNSPYGVARDPARRITYVADTLNHRIRAVLDDGTIKTVAGDGVAGYGGDGGPAGAARLSEPRGLALGVGGVLLVADTGNHAVRRLDPVSGIITTVAGTGTAGYGGDGGPAQTAGLDSPAGVAVDGSNLYVADTGNHRIRRVDLAGGTITTVAGNGTAGFGGDGGDPDKAELSSPFGVAVGPAGELVIADTGNDRVRVVSGGGQRSIATLAGNGSPASLTGVSSVATWDPGGREHRSRTFLADPFAGTVREVDEQGRITTVLGDGRPGRDNGRLAYPFGLATDRASPPRFLYVADTFNNVVRRVDLGGGTVSTVAGTGAAGYGGDGGPATQAALSFPTGVAVDSAGNLYIADAYNARIRRVDTNGTITTVAGTGRLGFSGDGGRAADADLFFPYGVAASGADPPDLYVADTFNHRIRRVAGADGVITTVAGNGVAALAGDGKAARTGSLDRPWGVAVDDTPRPDVYVADTGNGRLRRVDGATGVLSSLTPGAALTAFDPADPLAYGPRGVAVARRFTADEVNPAPGKLIVVADSRGGRVARAGLALAEPDAAALSFQTTSFDLGCSGTCMTKTVTFSNPGSATLAVRQVVISGDQAGDFRLVADGCSRRGVPRGRSCAMRIAFSPGATCPTVDACRQARLTIADNGADGDREILLAGSALRQAPDMATHAGAASDTGTVFTTDDATVQRRPGGGVPTGTVDFYLCGPLGAADGCPSGGNRSGTTKPLDGDGHAASDRAPLPPSGGEVEYWCWRAEYGGDRFYLPTAHSDPATDCVGVAPGAVIVSPSPQAVATPSSSRTSR